MIRLVFGLHRLPPLSVDEFALYWRDRHAPLVASVAAVLGIRRYVQLHPLTGTVPENLANSRGLALTFDGIAELWFDSEAAITESTSTADGRRAARLLLEDERRFIDLDRSPIWLYDEHDVLGGEPDI